MGSGGFQVTVADNTNLVANTAIAAIAFMTLALFRPDSSYAMMVAVLAVGGHGGSPARTPG